VLAWAKRSRALAVTAVLYAGAALLANLYDVANLSPGTFGNAGRSLLQMSAAARTRS
jgi:hypothetical protein